MLYIISGLSVCSFTPLQRNISTANSMGGKKKLFHWRSILGILSLHERQLRGDCNSSLSNHEGNGEIVNCFKMQIGAVIETVALQFKNKCMTVVFSTMYNWGEY